MTLSTVLLAVSRLATAGVLASLALVVIAQLITGRISTRGLITERPAEGPPRAGFAKIQHLVVTIAVAGIYVRATISATGPSALPDMSAAWLVTLAASNAIYLLSRPAARRAPPTPNAT